MMTMAVVSLASVVGNVKSVNRNRLRAQIHAALVWQSDEDTDHLHIIQGLSNGWPKTESLTSSAKESSRGS